MPKDKQKHILVGVVISVIFSLTFSPLVGAAAGITAGAAKEVWDSMGHGTPDIWDFAATATGAISASLIVGAIA